MAFALAAEGAAVVVNGRHADAVTKTVAELEAAGAEVAGHVGSVADFACAGALVDLCVDRFGRLDALVNCAGTAEPEGSSILDIAPDAWRDLIDNHLTATFNTCRHAAPRMVAQGAGAIVNTSSHAYLGSYGGTGYAAGKGGVNSLTFAIAADLREHGIRANAVCPGARTRLSSGPAYEAKVRDLHARGLLNDVQRDASLHPPDPEHAGPLYTFLASELSAPLTGEVFSTAGGYVGRHAPGGREKLVAYRDADAGAWPVPDLARAIRGTLEGEARNG